MLNLYNSFTKSKIPLKTLTPNTVKLYVCGVTVYDACHIGHGRVFLVFDVLVRYLHSLGFAVEYVRNITDIDDKIINRARERNISIEALTNESIAKMHIDFEKLKLLPPTHEPRATQFLSEMQAIIKTLLDNGTAYQGTNHDIYFAVDQFKAYGELSRQDLSALKVGQRVEADPFKKNPLDFVLWKAAKPEEPAYDSPWGKGRPGWHIECSAMSMHYLGEQFDIHGGGADLLFPHHENERAQSECSTNKQYVNTWMHVGFVNINDEKMSKSLNNFYTIEDVLNQYHPEVVRLFMLQSHYRSALQFSFDGLNTAYESLKRLYTALRGVELIKNDDRNAYDNFFKAAMDDDLNTPVALATIFELAREVNRAKENNENAGHKAYQLKRLSNVLGLLNEEPTHFLQSKEGVDSAAIENKIAERQLAKKNKDFAKADAIRSELLKQGIVLEDTKEGVIWRIQKDLFI